MSKIGGIVKKFILSLLAISLLSLSTIANAKSIRIGTEGAYPPWNNLNSAGGLEGAEIDFGNEACKRMGVDCEWVTQDWDGIIPALLNGKYDIIVAGRLNEVNDFKRYSEAFLSSLMKE